jgi:GDPmannose 4,6-dehydratase
VDKTILITGINGMDGTFMAQFLLGKGYKVFGLTRKEIPNPIVGVTYVFGDLLDTESLYRCLDSVKPDEIYNLGAEAQIKPSWVNPKQHLHVNGISIVDFLEYIRTKSPHTKLFNAGSAEMFGYTQESPQTENTKFSPRNPYGSVKIYAHDMIKHYRSQYGVFACTGILYNHESELRGLEMVTRKITNGVAKISLGLSNKITLGNLDAIRDWGYVLDYCEAMWMTLQHDKSDEYIISSGVPKTIKDFLDSAFKVVGIEDWSSFVGIDERFVRPVEKFPLVGDNTKLKNIGWSPRTSFDKMVEIMVLHDIKELKNEENNISM